VSTAPSEFLSFWGRGGSDRAQSPFLARPCVQYSVPLSCTQSVAISGTGQLKQMLSLVLAAGVACGEHEAVERGPGSVKRKHQAERIKWCSDCEYRVSNIHVRYTNVNTFNKKAQKNYVYPKLKLKMGSDPVLAVRTPDQSSMANTRGAPGTRPLRPLARRWPSAVSAFPRTAGQSPAAFAARSWLHTMPRE